MSEAALIQDLDVLKNQWNFIQKTVIAKSFPTLVYKDEDLIKKIVRDFYEENIKKIIIDSKDGLKLLYYYLNKWNCVSPITNIKLQLYNKQECILEQFNIKQTIKEALKPKVKLTSGGYIIIENNEAFTVIDVNSGSFNKTDNSREAILRTNFYAAIEIAQQLRIRNINGVIIVDFIDMHSQRDQLQLLEHFSKLLKFDNAKPQIVQLSELGLVELTRRRRGQNLQEIFGTMNIYESSYIESSFKATINISRQNLAERLLVHKNIRSLFFRKQFNKCIVLKMKQYKPIYKSYSEIKYFSCIDKINTIMFFNPKANYIVPLIFYLVFIQSRLI